MRFFVFARTEYDQPVARQATLEAPGAEAAAEQARARFGDRLEVRLVPEGAVRWIVGPLPADKVPENEREEVTAA
jgi:1,2-phenylacetyl-CoA epoxidase PaaB subunit